jgi:diadenylate cyclase
MVQQVQGLLMTMRLWDILDILVVAFFLYRIYLLIRNTRATALVKGLLLLGGLTLVTGWLQLHALAWILDKLMAVLIVALPIVFQPELRRALEQIGRGKFIRPGAETMETDRAEVIDAVAGAAETMGKNRVGALIVFERSTGLDDYIDTGIRIDGVVSREILGNIFIVNTPLHDGAVIIRENRIMAAGCLLPLTKDRSLSSELGTRHRAAIGMSEVADCVVVVVSEETGTISYAYDGHIYRHMDGEGLRNRLRSFLLLEQSHAGSVSGMIRKWRGGKADE